MNLENVEERTQKKREGGGSELTLTREELQHCLQPICNVNHQVCKKLEFWRGLC